MLFWFKTPCQVTTVLNFRSLILGVTPFGLFIYLEFCFVLYTNTTMTHPVEEKTSVVKAVRVNVGICDNGDKEHVPSIRSVHKLFYNLYRLKMNIVYLYIINQ